MNESHPNPFPAAEEPDSVEVHDVPMQHWGVGHCAVLGGSLQCPNGWGKVQHPMERLSQAGRAEHRITLCFTSVCNWKQDLAKLLLTPESWNLLKSKEILEFNPRKWCFVLLWSPGMYHCDGPSCRRPSGPGDHVKLWRVLSQVHCWSGWVSANPISPTCCGTRFSFLQLY